MFTLDSLDTITTLIRVALLDVVKVSKVEVSFGKLLSNTYIPILTVYVDDARRDEIEERLSNILCIYGYLDLSGLNLYEKNKVIKKLKKTIKYINVAKHIDYSLKERIAERVLKKLIELGLIRYIVCIFEVGKSRETCYFTGEKREE